MTMKAHTYYIIFGRPPIGARSFPLPAPSGATGQRNRAASRRDSETRAGSVTNEMRARGAELADAGLSDAACPTAASIYID